LAGDAIPLVEREVYYAANEMQLLEDSVSKFKKRLIALTGADNNATSRRKDAKAVWEETKEPAKKRWVQSCCRNLGWWIGRRRPTSSIRETTYGTHVGKTSHHIYMQCLQN
jgi:hypothetical protein